jgi:hypothetical protein
MNRQVALATLGIQLRKFGAKKCGNHTTLKVGCLLQGESA